MTCLHASAHHIAIDPLGCQARGPGVGGASVRKMVAIMLWMQALLWIAFLLLPFTGKLNPRARSTILGAGASGLTRGSLPRSRSYSGTRRSYGAPRGVRCGTTRCCTRGSRLRSMRSSPWRSLGQDTSNRWTRRRGGRTRRSCSSCAAGAPSATIRRPWSGGYRRGSPSATSTLMR